MFVGFETSEIEGDGARIHVTHGGAGPPLLLLHGYPQTHVMWHKTVSALAENFTVIAPDLRGYGDSDKPPTDDAHAPYSFRAMAADQVAVMRALGHEQFFVAGHDRGGRVGHRMALDHRDRVTRLAVLDIVPTLKIYSDVSRGLATDYYHWFFLIQPHDFPERLLGADPEYYIHKKVGQWSAGSDVFSPEATAEYVRCFSDPATIHATCEDYRAGASIDLDHDREDLNTPLGCPLLVLWGAKGAMERNYDVLASWRERATDVRGKALDCGHFLPEEKPEEVVSELMSFFLD